jgi:hypothetical protein
LISGDSVFTERLNQEIKTYQKEKQEKGFVSVKDKRTPSNKEQELSLIEKKKLAKKTEDRRTEKNPPVEKVVVLAPGAYSGSIKIVMVTNRTYRLDFVLDLEKTGKEQKKTRDILESALEKSNLEYEWLDLKKVDGADEFNDYVNLQAWLNEFWIHPTEDNRVTEMVNIQDFIEKYQTPYVLLTAQEITHLKLDLVVPILYTMFFPVANPYLFPLLMSNELKTKSFTNHMVLINLENGTIRTVRKDEDLSYSKHVRANLLYGHLLDLKTASQEKK